MTLELFDGAKLGKDTAPYVVAELNTSHFGDVDTAISMMKTAKEVGCDCVKFQSWDDRRCMRNPSIKKIQSLKGCLKSYPLGKRSF